MAETKQYPGKGKLWVTARDAERPIVLGQGAAGTPATTVMRRFKERKDKLADKTSMGVKRDGVWKTYTWNEYYNQTIQLARALIKFGLEMHEAVCIIGFNSPEWFIADLAAIAAGGIAAGIYTTNQADACHYIAHHCEARVIFVENDQQLKKFLQIRDRLPKLKALVQWSGKVPEGEKDVYTWDEFMKFGNEIPESEVQKRIDATKPTHCCTLIYTSGTTGPPKAVMISHDNITWTSGLVVQMLQFNESDSVISYLPLSHVAAQMIDVHGPMATGVTIWFAQPDALKGSLGVTLKEIRPSAFLGVPRVWEKIYEKMQEVGKQNTGWKKNIAEWAKDKGLQGNYSIQKGENVPWGWWLANTLVFDNVKKALGLDRTRFCATAAAPIARETLDYFLSLNIPIYEIYGMSECTGPQTINRPNAHKTGTAGPSIPGTEMKIQDPDKDGNGEICYRGRHIFMGYLNNDKDTNDTIDADGFLHSGDVGKVDKDGFLSITGRIKELIITAGGENIPPVLIEDEIKYALSDVLSNIMVIGDRKKFLSCVVTLKAAPKPDSKPGEYPFTNGLAPSALAAFQAAGSKATTIDEAIKDPKVREFIENGIKKANKKATSNAQIIQKFEIIKEDFTIEGNELTPTMKLKRRIVLDKHKEIIEKMYEDSGNV